MQTKYHQDILIIGAGSAGCVMAQPVERRPTTPSHGGWRLEVQTGTSSYGCHQHSTLPVLHPRLNWGYTSEPEPNLGHRRLACPRGRVLGGSSAINGMVYVRGHPEDFEPLGGPGRQRVELPQRAALLQNKLSDLTD